MTLTSCNCENLNQHRVTLLTLSDESKLSEMTMENNLEYIYKELDYVENPLDYIGLAKSIRQFIQERKDFLDEVWIENKNVVNLHFYENSNRTVGIIEGETLQNFPSYPIDIEDIDHWVDIETGECFTLDTPVTRETTIIPVLKNEVK